MSSLTVIRLTQFMVLLAQIFKQRSKPAMDEGQSRERGWKSSISHHASTARRKVWPFLKENWLDTIYLGFMGLLTLVVFNAPALANRTFLVGFENDTPVAADLKYAMKKRPYIVSTVQCGLIAAAVPILVFVLMQYRVRSFHDIQNAILGLQYSIATSALMHVLIACLVGGLRPNFFDVCKPKLDHEADPGREMFELDRCACTAENPRDLDYVFSSFPSGHATASFSGLIYLSLYLNAKLKTWSNYRPSCWKLAATCAPVLAAILISGQCTIDHSHHWYDVLAGSILGTAMAFSAFRMMYASVWDFRFNHVPLIPNVPFKFCPGRESNVYDGLDNAVWTRKAGWGHGVSGGAPFDSASPGSFAVDNHEHLEKPSTTSSSTPQQMV